jgi:hypothetical protein
MSDSTFVGDKKSIPISFDRWRLSRIRFAASGFVVASEPFVWVQTALSLPSARSLHFLPGTASSSCIFSLRSLRRADEITAEFDAHP